MNTTRKALFLGTLASLIATSALNAATYYIGSALGAVSPFGGGAPLGGSITNRDAGAIAPASVWDLGGGEVVLAAGNNYILDNYVYITNGTLVINAGVVVRGQPASSATNFDVGALVVTSGAKISANGSSTAPIIFTTASSTGPVCTGGTDTVVKFGGRASGATPTFWDSAPATAPRPLVTTIPGGISPTVSASSNGLWGGLVVLGKAPSNVDRNLFGADNGGASGGAYDDAGRITFADENGGSAGADDRQQLEGVLATSVVHPLGLDRFGGNISNDSSGVLRYVSLRYCGSNLSANSEINGLTLGCVGAGTVIDYFEVFGCTDDLVEVFGGTVNLKHIVVMGGEDDMFDFDAGYNGTAQFLFGVGWGFTGSSSTSADYTDRAFEWDGSYRFERPEGYRASPEASRAINAGGLGAVTANQSAVGGNMVYNATVIGNVYSGPAMPITVAGNAANNDRSRGIMLRDQAAPFLRNSIILPTSQYGLRVATMGALDYTATISRLQTGRAAIESNTFYQAGKTVGLDFLTALATATAAGANNATRTDVAPATIDAIISAASARNVFNTDPGFTITVNESLTAGTIDPRPLNAYSAGSPVVAPTAPAPVGAGVEKVEYRGAFSDDPFSDLWTTGWTAANRLGIIVN